MKPFIAVLLLCLLSLLPVAAAEDSPQDLYVNIYGLIQQGDLLAQQGKAGAALARYGQALDSLKRFKKDYPDWNVPVVKYRLDYLTAKLTTATNAPAKSAGSSAASGSATPAMAAEAGEPVEMKLKWELGKRYLQRMEMTQGGETGAAGTAAAKTETKIAQDFALSAIKDTDGGGHELELEILGITMNMKMRGTTLMNYDSGKPGAGDDANPAAALFKKMIGAKIKYLVDANGKVLSVEGFQDFVAKLSEGSAPEMAGLLKSVISEDSIKQMNPSQGLPDKPVKIGDTWPISMEMAAGQVGTMVMNMNYTFTGWEDRDARHCAVLGFTGEITTKPGADGMASMVSITRGKITGKSLFDPAQGIMIDNAMNQELAMKMSAAGQSINMTLNQAVDNKLVSVTDIPK